MPTGTKEMQKFLHIQNFIHVFLNNFKDLTLHTFSQAVDLNSDDKWTNQSSQEIGWDWRWGS